MIEGVLFDKDGTLFSFTETWGEWCERLLTALSPDDSKLRRRMAAAIGYNPDQRSFTKGATFISESADQTVATLSELLPAMSPGQVASIGLQLQHQLPLFPVTDLPALFAELKASGLRVGLATNDYESTAKAHLKQLGVFDYFDFVCGFDSGYGSKPSPGMITAFCDRVALDPTHVAMVGDSMCDIDAGRAAGVALTVGVLTGPAGYDELDQIAHAVVPDISHLPGLLLHEARD